MQNMSKPEPILSPDEIDAIGEVLNISMGSAATAVSTMLDRQVVITTPRVSVENFYDVDYAQLEPAIAVKIEYVEGISGSNVMVFRTADMQVILNLLMGSDDVPSEDVVFDELSMSAACEVMNQMMGSSATALSEFLGKSINISTPEASILGDVNTFQKAVGVESDEKIISVAFTLNIEGVMNSDFISVMTCELAKMIVDQVMGDQKTEPIQEVQSQPTPPPQTNASLQAPPPQHDSGAVMGNGQQQSAPQPGMPGGVAQGQPQPPPYYDQQQQGYPPQQPYGAPPYPMQQQGYPPQYPPQYNPMYPPNVMYPQYGYGMPSQGGDSQVMKQAVDVKNAQFPSFYGQQQQAFGNPLARGNMELVMNVPLNVSIEIGKTKRKIKDIMEFNQGTVIELEKQAGAPVDVVVNGQLIARGDVVVIGDNFGVRVTEIIGTQEMMNALTKDAL